jgi:hypothetical protein
MKLIDNVNHRLGDDLKESIKKGSKLSIAASSFSIYAYEALKKELERTQKGDDDAENQSTPKEETKDEPVELKRR